MRDETLIHIIMSSYFKKSSVISKNLKLAEVSGMFQSSKDERIEIAPSINHVFCIDISGSMTGELKKMRTQLKSRLVEIVKDNDTVTLIWFNNNCGFISEMVHINSAKDVRDMNSKIDEFLKASGWTNFLKPIHLTYELIDRMKKVDGLWNFIFLSDGGHNDGPWSQIVDALQEIQPKISSASIIEYGYYADSKRLTEMAEILGGQKVFDKDFDDYSVDFESIMTNSLPKSNRVEFDVTDFKSSMRLQLMFTVNKVNKCINVYSTQNKSSILIPEDTEKIYYLEKNISNNKTSNSNDNDLDIDSDLEGIYALIYILAGQLKYDLAEELLYSIKDKEMIDLYTNSYGKQKLEEFKKHILDRCYGVTRPIEFTSNSYKPNYKKYCVLDLLDDLSSSELNKIYIFHPEFNYNRTGAKSVNKIELTDDEKDKLSKATTKLKADKVLKEVDKNQVKMTIKNPDEGYSIKNLVWNNERANISFQVNIDVELNLPKEAPIKSYNSFITRNYTIIKDGILNITSLPVSISNSQLKGKFKRMGLVKSEENGIVVLDFSSMPILNKKRTETVYMSDLSSLELKLLEYRCFNKYLSYLKSLILSSTNNMNSVSNSVTVSNSVKEYLKSIGVTERGYSPKTELDYSGDFYMAASLVTKIQNFSSIPKIEDVYKKLNSKKPLTKSETYLKVCMDKVDYLLSNSSDKSEALNELITSYKRKTKEVLHDISSMKFSIIVSRKWFADTKDQDEDSTLVQINGDELSMKFEFVDKKVSL